jgi:hypothetical protein
MSKKAVPGTLWERLGFRTKEELYADTEFQRRVSELWEKLEPGSYVVWCDVNPKTEVLPIGKDGRTVYCVDATTIILMAMLLWDQNAKLNAAPMEALWMWSGKSPFGYGTHKRYEWITNNGKWKRVWDIDVKKMEANLRLRDMLAFAKMKYEALDIELRTGAAGSRNWLRLLAVYCGLAEGPFILPNGETFWKGAGGEGGNPSGQFCTQVDNSLRCLRFVIEAFITACDELQLQPDEVYFWRNVRGVIMGDDLEMSISDEFETLLEPLLKRYSEELGHEVTWGEYVALVAYREYGTVMESPCWEGVHPMDSVFCGMRFQLMTDPISWMTFSMDMDKQLSAILQGGTQRTPEEQLQRLASYRLQTWGNEEHRRMISHVYAMYKSEMEKTDPTLAKNENWQLAQRAYLSDMDLLKIYTEQVPLRMRTVNFDEEFEILSGGQSGYD